MLHRNANVNAGLNKENKKSVGDDHGRRSRAFLGEKRNKNVGYFVL